MNLVDWSEGSQWLLALAYVVVATFVIGSGFKLYYNRWSRKLNWTERLHEMKHNSTLR
jgi:hypothetical protein